MWAGGFDNDTKIKIEIESTADGEKSVLMADGVFKANEDGFTIFYTQAGELPEEDVEVEVRAVMADGTNPSGADEPATKPMAPEKIIITYTRAMKAQLIFEEGTAHDCVFETPYGDIIMAIKTKSLSVTDSCMNMNYSIYAGEEKVGENAILMSVKPA